MNSRGRTLSLLAFATSLTGLGVIAQASAQTESQGRARAELEGQAKPRERPERHVVLMPVVGLWGHTFKNSRYESKPGPVWGLDVVIDPFRFMNVRGSVMRGNQPLSLPSDALSSEVSSYQPTLELLRMDMRLEPVYHVSDRLSFYAGLGLGWARLTAPEPVTVPRVVAFQRNSVYVGYEGALGAQFEPIVDWMLVDFSVAASRLANQSGNAYEKVQAFTEDGHRTELSALSRFGMGYRMCLGVGIIL